MPAVMRNLGFIASAAIWFAPAHADTFRLSIGSGHPVTATWIATMNEAFQNEITDRVAAETDHEIRWTEAFGASVCKLGECLEAVEAGLLDVTQVQTPFEPSKLQAQNFAYFVPFGTPDSRVCAEAANATYDRVPAMREMFEEEYNQVFLAASCASNYGILTTFPWETVEDLAGRKIAAAGPNAPWYDGTGVVVVQASLNEAYTSLQTGVIEGYTNYSDGAVSFKLTEVAPYWTYTDFGAIPASVITINKDTWESLPSEVQSIFEEAATEWSVHLAETAIRTQEEADAFIEANGGTVSRLSEEEKQAWAAGLENLPRIRTDEINANGQPGEAVYAYIEALIERGHTFPRDWLAEQ